MHMTTTMTNNALMTIAKAAKNHCDGWRSAFFPLVDEDEVLDTQQHWAPMMAAALRNDMQAFLSALLDETAFYAAVDYQTRQRWNFYSDMSFLSWHQQFPSGTPYPMDAKDPRISRDKVLLKLQQWSACQHELG